MDKRENYIEIKFNGVIRRKNKAKIKEWFRPLNFFQIRNLSEERD